MVGGFKHNVLELTTGKPLQGAATNPAFGPLQLVGRTPGLIYKGIQTDYGAVDERNAPDPVAGISGWDTSRIIGPYFVEIFVADGSNITLNFGATSFVNTAPTGYSAWGAATTLTNATTGVVLSGGNLTATAPANVGGVAISTTSHASGKFYFELTCNTIVNGLVTSGFGIGAGIGICNSLDNLLSTTQSKSTGTFSNGVFNPFDTGIPSYFDRGSPVFSNWAGTNVIGIAVDLTAGRMWTRINNGAWFGNYNISAFINFRTFGRNQGTNQVLLDLQGGQYRLFNSAADPPFNGVKRLIIWGYGASFINGGTQFPAASADYPIFNTAGLSAKINAVTAGESKVVCKNISDASKFSKGNWCLISAFEIQGIAGYPPNFQIFEYAQVAKVDVTAGIIYLTLPLKYSYSDQYFETNLPSNPNVGYDPSGPAQITILLVNQPSGQPDNRFTGFEDQFDTEIEFHGVSFTSPNFFVTLFPLAKYLRFVGCSTDNNTQLNPTASKDIIFEDFSCPGAGLLFDKNIDTVTINNSQFGTASNLFVSTSSLNKLNINNCSMASINAGAQINIINNLSLSPSAFNNSFGIGSAGFGEVQSVTVSNSQLDSMSPNFFNQIPISALASTVVDNQLVLYGTIDNLPSKLGFGNPMTPETNYIFWLWKNQGLPLIPFKVTKNISRMIPIVSPTNPPNNPVWAVYTDLPTNINLSTIDPGFAPPYDQQLQIGAHPCMNFTMTNCTGNTTPLIFTDLSGAPPNRPLWSWSSRTFGANNTGGATIPLWGRVNKITVNVSQPYTGSQPQMNLKLGNQFTTSWTGSQISLQQYDFTINTMIPGTRVITQTTTQGLRSGDSVVPPNGLCFQQILPAFDTAFGGGDTGPQKPIVTLTMDMTHNSLFS